jgi:hypothetical protein
MALHTGPAFAEAAEGRTIEVRILSHMPTSGISDDGKLTWVGRPNELSHGRHRLWQGKVEVLIDVSNVGFTFSRRNGGQPWATFKVLD